MNTFYDIITIITCHFIGEMTVSKLKKYKSWYTNLKHVTDLKKFVLIKY